MKLKPKLIKSQKINLFPRASRLNQDFLNYLELIVKEKNTNFSEIYVKTNERKGLKYSIDFYNLIILFKFQNNILVRKKETSIEYKKIFLEKKISFLKEDISNFLFCTEIFY